MARTIVRDAGRAAPDTGRRGEAGAWRARGRGMWPGGWRLHGPVLALLALGAGIGLVLWGRWGFLVAFDAIRTYCF